MNGIAIIAAVFSASASMLAGKVFNFGPLTITAGLFTITVFAVLLDVINELQGRDEARKFVVWTLVAKVLLYSYILLATQLPGKEVTPFNKPMLFAVRAAFIAEAITFVANWFMDIPIFNALKKVKGGFFVRTNLSNLLSLTIMTISYCVFVYWGKENLQSIVVGQTSVRLVMALAMTPFTALIVKYLRK